MTSRIRVAKPPWQQADCQQVEPCPLCHGKGLWTEVRKTKHPWIEEEVVDSCPTCHGEGVVDYWSDADCQQVEPCPRCKGVGELPEFPGARDIQDYDECPDCAGTGVVSYWRDEGAGE